MQLVLEQSGEVRVLRVKEPRLTYRMLPSFLAQACEIVEEGARRLVIDLEAVTYIDSAAIGCLINVYRLLGERDGTLKVSGLQPRVGKMLLMTGVHRIMDVHCDAAEALAAFREGRTGSVAGLSLEP